jgi:hypothetical protein
MAWEENMTDEAFDFAFNAADVNREEVLSEAAQRLDILSGQMGGFEFGGGLEGASAPAGDFARQLMEEQASLPAFPDIYKISDKDFLARSLTAPVKFAQLSKQFNFYWIRFPVGLAPSHNWTFNRIEVRVEFNPGFAEAHLRPKAYQILPNKQFQTLVEANQGLEVSFNENFELTAKTGVVGGKVATGEAKANVGVDGVASGGFGLVLGPFNYKIKRAKIEHNSTGMEWVFWRLDGAEFTQEDAPDLIVVAQVPKELKEFTVLARLQAYHNFNFSAASVQSAISNLPRLMRDYFKGGAPLFDEKPWNLTPRL